MATNATNHTTGTRSGEKEKTYLTRGGYEEKKERLQSLVTVRRHEAADYIRDGAEAADVSERSALDAPKVADGNRTVQLGSTVEVETPRGPKTFTLVSTVEANSAANKLSDQSPVGRALMGRGEGEKVEITTPGGSATYTIKAIR